ncbi:unnamed protein product [Dracunculus medinensis]|uniref:Protein CDV3 homolog n=1 Tax=Dracunculus medinensis TaxID=318479 RepID=A0A0N4UA18_DRAME|nr:unnamed protein product [Dracunculus medinensis]
MADDLTQFLAKKAAKSREKKKKLKVEDVGNVLDRKAKKQEENDRTNEEEERRIQNDEAFFEKRLEDSEWLDFRDTNKEISLEELGIRDMNLTEQVEEALEEEKTIAAEAPKTWNTSMEPKESNEIPLILPQKPAIYRPKHIQLATANRTGPVININDQEMFPTFEAAEKMEKLRKDDDKKKKNDGFTMVTSDRERDSNPISKSRNNITNNGGRRVGNRIEGSEAILSAVRQVTSTGNPHPVPQQSQAPKNPKAYVPPSLRRAEAMQKTQ